MLNTAKKATLTLGFATVLFSLLGFLGRLWWPFELMSHFRVQYLGLLVVSTVLFVLIRWRKSAVFLLILATYHITLIQPFYQKGPTPPTNQTVYRAVGVNWSTLNKTPEAILDFIKTADADFLSIQELPPNTEPIRAQISEQYEYSLAFDTAFTAGMILYSRYPIIEGEILELQTAKRPSLSALIQLPDTALRIVTTHPISPRRGELAQQRNDQLKRVSNILATLEPNRLLLGDLNLTHWSPLYNDFLTTANLNDARLGFGLNPTWPTYFPLLNIPIDQAFVSETLTVHTFTTGSDIGSDHLPIIIDFS